jgi:poly(beta-D-mannuronate) C5 epimerase
MYSRILNIKVNAGRGYFYPVLMLCCLFLMLNVNLLRADNTNDLPNYRVRASDPNVLTLAAPNLPALEAYTRSAIEAKINRKKTAQISLKRMIKQPALEDFTAGGRLSEWATRQFSQPQAIFIENGYADIHAVAKQIDKKFLEEVQPGIFIVRLPIVVAQGAMLEIGSTVKSLRLSEESGAFLVNDGTLFLIGSKLEGWRESIQASAQFVNKKSFRPFLVSWGGTELYVVDSAIESLGYHMSKSYGFTMTQYTSDLKDKQNRKKPRGWIIHSSFKDLYYGFYCYGAEDVVIINNTYQNNVIYGIDPHDYSTGLIIADNDVFDTQQKHGIIVSREVNNSFIFNNRSYNNKLSGIVIDRKSEGNVIASNWVAENGSDGITLYESSNNLLWKNVALANKRHGIRLRNSMNIKLYNNVALSNERYGIVGQIKDLSNTARNFKLDSYKSEISMTVVGGGLMSNVRGPLSIDRPLALQMYGIDFRTPDNRYGVQLTGTLNEFQDPILDILFKQRKAVIVEPALSAMKLN